MTSFTVDHTDTNKWPIKVHSLIRNWTANKTTASSKSRNYFDELKNLRINLKKKKQIQKMRPESRPVSVPLLQQLWIISIKNDNRSPMKISRGAWITEVRLLLFQTFFLVAIKKNLNNLSEEWKSVNVATV